MPRQRFSGFCRFWDLEIPDSRLCSPSRQAWAPMSLSSSAAARRWGPGRGEEIYPLPDFPPQHLVVIFPGIHVSTAEAYRSLNLGLTSSLQDP